MVGPWKLYIDSPQKRALDLCKDTFGERDCFCHGDGGGDGCKGNSLLYGAGGGGCGYGHFNGDGGGANGSDCGYGYGWGYGDFVGDGWSASGW